MSYDMTYFGEKEKQLKAPGKPNSKYFSSIYDNTNFGIYCKDCLKSFISLNSFGDICLFSL